MYVFAPLGRTRRPNPGKSVSHMTLSLASGWMESRSRFEIRRLEICRSVTSLILGKHRGSTTKEIPGNLRQIGNAKPALFLDVRKQNERKGAQKKVYL
jgi:hypothetical protein